MTDGSLVHLGHPEVSVVLDLSTGAPTILHWGAPLGDVDPATLRRALTRARPFGDLDDEVPLTIVPEHGLGWAGRPALLGHRHGLDWAPRFVLVDADRREHGVTTRAIDTHAGLALEADIDLDAAGVLTLTATVTNTGTDDYELQHLGITLPLPDHATELMGMHGRWLRELQPYRVPFVGAHTSESRRGRTSHDRPPLLFAGETGFGEQDGEVWGVHVAWSGDHVVHAESLADGRRSLHAGELLWPGEVVLPPGGSHATPRILAVYGRGLLATSRAFHRHLRARPHHPRSVRKVIVNTWEAVYFDHDRPTLLRLADVAARVGAERFVLDDGWFLHRRHDRAGLGDWVTDESVHPGGLSPLIEHVRALGMDFGLWVEPEMVNPDSDLYRAHPDWVLHDPRYPAVLGRHQLVLDLARDEVRAQVLDLLDRLLIEHDIAYLKWDMNRDLVQPAHGGHAGTHRQTLAVYALLDELRARHPQVEIESCASGGGRIDLGILERTDRVWTSDCNDALERQLIQRGCSLLLPPELIGAHIGPRRAHTTGRQHPLAFRAATALFGHLGIEWNLLEASEAELDRLAALIALHKELRPLLHHGEVLRVDTSHPSLLVHGVLGEDRDDALAAAIALDTFTASRPPALRVPGLRPATHYRVRHLALPGEVLGPQRVPPPWLATGATLTGRQLDAHGVALPVLRPGSVLLVRATAV